MTLTRWRPQTGMTLRDAARQLFEDAFIDPLAQTSISGGMFPVDIHETGDAIEVDASIPGAKPENIEVSATGSSISIKAEIERHTKQGEGEALREERYEGVFQRSFTLPTQIDPNKVEATYENGVLCVVLPKSESVRPKRVTVTAQQGNGKPTMSRK
jgi:HSP20 family protein